MDKQYTILANHAWAFAAFIEKSQNVKSDRHANSSRTKKAREKLLKLSLDQFSELSTDVYDESNRRQLSESRRPNYLLEDDIFHPKRNQARKKLSSLPESRFKDLVTDMLYEIDRRGIKPQKQTSNSATHGDAVTYSNHAPPSIASNNSNNAADRFGVQAGTVIPTKSTLAWSSDDEDENADLEHQNDINRNLNKNYNNSSSKNNDDKTRMRRKFERDSVELSGIDDDTKTVMKTNHEENLENLNPFTTNYQANDTHQLSNSSSNRQIENYIQQIDTLKEENLKMDQTITIHENKIRLLKDEISKLNKEKSDLKNSQEETYGKIYLLEREINAHKMTISLLENEYSNSNENKNNKEADDEALEEISKLSFTIKNLEREKQSNEVAYLDLRENHDKVEKEYKLLLEDYKLLQEKYNSFKLSEDDINIEQKKNFKKIRQLQDENKSLTDQLEIANAQLEAERLKVTTENSGSDREAKSDENTDDNDRNIESLKLQILDWQKKYQDLRAESIKTSMRNDETMNYSIKPADLSESGIKDFINEDAGLISMKSVAELNQLISSFLLIVHDNNLSTDLLFETITKITIVAGDIASQGESIKGGEISSLIKASVSHAITATRFYAIHGKSLPKLVVETAISEISFCVCNLIAAAKASNSVEPSSEGLDPKTISTNLLNGSGNGINDKKDDNDLLKSVDDWQNKNLDITNSLGIESHDSDFDDGYYNKATKSADQSFKGKELRITKGSSNHSPIITSRRENPPSSFTMSPSILKASTFSPGLNLHSPQNKFKPGLNPYSAVDTKGLDNDESDNKNNELDDNSLLLKSDGEDRNPFNDDKSSNKSFDDSFVKNNSLASENKVGDSATSAPVKKNWISDIAMKFIGEKQEEKKNMKNEVSKDEPKGAVLSTGILSRMKALEFSLNGDNVNNKITAASNVRPLPEDTLKKFGSLSRSGIGSDIADPKATDLGDTSVSSTNPYINEKEDDITSNLIDQNKNFDSSVENNDDNDNDDDDKLSARNSKTMSERMVAVDFDINTFDIANPDNTLSELLLYLEHQTVDVISTIQSLLSSIKTPDSTTGNLKESAKAICDVVFQMFDATNTSMAQTRNNQLREHGRWVVQTLEDCGKRMEMICENDKSDNDDYADKHFKQRLAGIAFDIAKCTKELVKTVEEASLKEEISIIDARLKAKQM